MSGFAIGKHIWHSNLIAQRYTIHLGELYLQAAQNHNMVEMLLHKTTT